MPERYDTWLYLLAQCLSLVGKNMMVLVVAIGPMAFRISASCTAIKGSLDNASISTWACSCKLWGMDTCAQRGSRSWTGWNENLHTECICMHRETLFIQSQFHVFSIGIIWKIILWHTGAGSDIKTNHLKMHDSQPMQPRLFARHFLPRWP